MQETSETYQRIYRSGKYYYETTVVIGEGGRLITEAREILRFGGDAILISTGGADGGYGENMLISVKTSHRTFSKNVPQVGCCTVGEIEVEMYMPLGEFERMAMVTPFVRLVSTEDGTVSEWLRKGIFYVDTRDNTHNRDELDILRIHGYDAMIKAEVLYTPTISFPATDIDVVYDIASQMGVSLDTRSVPLLNKQYAVQLPIEYTRREVLGFIGGMYAGNWIINDEGQLQLICLYDLPEETSLLVDEMGYRLTFRDDTETEGKVRILL